MKIARILTVCVSGLAMALGLLEVLAWLPSMSHGPVTAQGAAFVNGGFEGNYQPWGSAERMIAPGWSLWYGDATTWPDERDRIDPPRAGEELSTSALAQRPSVCLGRTPGALTPASTI
jgi:hypothetical protein